MKSVLHDWDDGAAADILRTCRRAMPAAATLLAIERVVGPPNEDPNGKFFDLNMLVQYGALERTRQEFEDLFEERRLRAGRGRPDPLSPERHRRTADACRVMARSTVSGRGVPVQKSASDGEPRSVARRPTSASPMPRPKPDRPLPAEVGQHFPVGGEPLNACFGRQSRPRVPSAREPLSAQGGGQHPARTAAR